MIQADNAGTARAMVAVKYLMYLLRPLVHCFAHVVLVILHHATLDYISSNSHLSRTDGICPRGVRVLLWL